MGAGEGNLGALESSLENVTALETSYNNTAVELQTQVSKCTPYFYSWDITVFFFFCFAHFALS